MAHLIPKHNSGYKILKGDTLSKIAKQHNVSINELARLNNIKDINKINAGTILKLPNLKKTLNVFPYKKEYPKLLITNSYTNLSWTPKNSNLNSNETAKQEAITKVAGNFDKKQNARLFLEELKSNKFGAHYKGNIDGIWGSGSKAALKQSLSDAGYDQNSINTMMNYVNKNIYSRDFSISKMFNFGKKARSQQSVSKLTPKSSSTVSYLYSVHPMFGVPLNVVSPKSQSTESAPPSNPKGGKAIYLHYPNFKGLAANALKIGNTDVGKEIFGTDNVLPVGHGETLLVDENGKVKYVRYGRYTTGTGHVRESVKGGNWGIYDYPDMKPDESTEQYINRLLDLRKKGAGHLLEDAKYGAFEAIEVPDVDFQKALDYATTQSNDKNRDEYSITNTCATGACNTIKAGLSTLDGLKTYIPNISLSDADADVSTSAWGLIPGSTNYHAATMRNLGKSYIFNK